MRDLARDRFPWDAIFAEFASWPPHERSVPKLARQFRVSEQAIRRGIRREGWWPRLQAIDEKARKRREERAIRKLADRMDDMIRIVEAGRVRYAERLRDPNYKVTGAGFASLARPELEIEGLDRDKLRSGAVSDNLKESLRRLPIYVQERIILSHMTGVPIDELMVLEESFEAEFDGDEDGPAD